MSKYVPKVTLRHVQIGRGSFRNFSGTKTKYNKNGKRLISLFLDDDTANAMKEEGWNIKYYIPRVDDEEEAREPIPFIEAELRYDNYPPDVTLEIGGNKQTLDEDDLVNLKLDQADIVDVDVRLSPYTWINDDGESKVKAYVDRLRIRMEDDF